MHPTLLHDATAGYASSIKKAEAVLGWKPKIALADGMAGVETELRRLGRI